MLAIEYVGKKPQKTDNVADTGLVWKPGEYHVVTEAVAFKLLKHPDIWAIANVELPEVGLRPVGLPEKKEEEGLRQFPIPSFDPNNATKNELKEYAQVNFGKVLDARHKQEDLAREVANLIQLHRLSE